MASRELERGKVSSKSYKKLVDLAESESAHSGNHPRHERGGRISIPGLRPGSIGRSGGGSRRLGEGPSASGWGKKTVQINKAW